MQAFDFRRTPWTMLSIVQGVFRRNVQDSFVQRFGSEYHM